MLKYILVLINAFLLINCQSAFDGIKIEALTPKGLRVTMPAKDQLQLFAFHGKLNKKIDELEPGDFYGEIVAPNEEGHWVYLNQDIQLQPGDTIHYWVFGIFNRLGFRRDKQEFKVTELVSPFKQCTQSETIVDGKRACSGVSILKEEFRTAIDQNNWIIEQYIPTYSTAGLDFEFVAYVNNKTNVFVQDEVLYLKPVVSGNDLNDLRGTLDLSDGCTSNVFGECKHRQAGNFLIPPVTSGKIRSKSTFKYGIYEIKAKLPRGEWLFPILRLTSIRNANVSLWLAYSRGNDRLTANDGTDIGSRVLFGGAVFNSEEPNRSKYLKSYQSNQPLNSDVHTYKCKWEKGKITFYVDNIEYGTLYTTDLPELQESEFYLTIGVGAGGINDFPDGYKSGINNKPWINKSAKNIKDFFNAKSKWLETWIRNECAMQIDSIKITAL